MIDIVAELAKISAINFDLQARITVLTAACAEARRLIYEHDDLTHWEDACSRDTSCDERDDDGCDVHGMDTCPRCECGAGKHNGDIRLAIATLDRALETK